MCRAARGLLGWSQADLAAKSSLARATIAAFEGGGAAIAPRSLRDIIAAFEAAGVVFLAPVEGVHDGAVGIKWGFNLSRRAGSEAAPGKEREPGAKAAPWDDFAEAEPIAPEIESLRTYWREHPAEWAALADVSRSVLLQEMQLDSLGAEARGQV